jgi:hypothetical protein
MGYDLQSLRGAVPSDPEIDSLLHRVVDEAKGDIFRQAQAMYDALESTGCYFRFNHVAWPKLIELAKKHGWAPVDDIRSTISEADATGMADALELALLRLENVQPTQSPCGETQSARARGRASILGPRHDLTAEAFWAADRGKIERFIQFARQGAFSIS